MLTACLACLVALAVNTDLSTPLAAIKSERQDIIYTFYVSGAPGNIEKAEVVKNGNSSIIACKIEDAKSVRRKLKDINGESLSYTAALSDELDWLCSFYSVTVYSTQSIDGITVISGYSSKLGDSIKIDGKNVNIQLAQNGTRITVGCPLILGSY